MLTTVKTFTLTWIEIRDYYYFWIEPEEIVISFDDKWSSKETSDSKEDTI